MTTTTLIESDISLSTNFALGVNLTAYQQALLSDTDMVTNKSAHWVAESISTETVRLEYVNYLTSFVNNYLGKLAYYSNQNAYSDIRDYLHTIGRRLESEKFLTEALDELAELDDCAKEEEFDPLSPIAKKLARKLLEELTHELPRYYAVSLWEDGDVVIYASGSGWRVNIFCRANGGASFYVNSPNKHDYEGHYESASDMPISLILDALKKLSARTLI